MPNSVAVITPDLSVSTDVNQFHNLRIPRQFDKVITLKSHRMKLTEGRRQGVVPDDRQEVQTLLNIPEGSIERLFYDSIIGRHTDDPPYPPGGGGAP